VQCILKSHPPEVYAAFVMAMAADGGVVDISKNKFGCRVIQSCLEQPVHHIESSNLPDKRLAYAVLHTMMEPILCHTRDLMENEYGNYIVQFVIGSKFLKPQCEHIIKHYILHNILSLSQEKFASHVVEEALKSADDELLEQMFNEIFAKDALGRDALDIMLFDQFGNYVVQRMIAIASDVHMNKRRGDKKWLYLIKQKIVSCGYRLNRYATGKKIIEAINDALKQVKLQSASMPERQAHPKETISQEVNLYVKNLDDDCFEDDDSLFKAFRDYGNISSAKLMRDEQERPKGFGFVCFERAEDANRAIDEMNGKLIGSKYLYVAVAQNKEERQKMLKQLYQPEWRGSKRDDISEQGACCQC